MSYAPEDYKHSKATMQRLAPQGGSRWSPDDTAQVEDAVRNGVKFEQVKSMFPGRSNDSLRHKIKDAKLKLEAQKHTSQGDSSTTVAVQTMKTSKAGTNTKLPPPWTAQGDHKLNDAILNGMDLVQTHVLFPDRSSSALRHRYKRNKDLLDAGTPTHSSPSVMSASDSEQVTTPLRDRPSVTKPVSGPALWNAADTQKLKDALHEDLGQEEIFALFPNRTSHAVRGKIRRIQDQKKAIRKRAHDSDDDDDDDVEPQIQAAPKKPLRTVFNSPGFQLPQRASAGLRPTGVVHALLPAKQTSTPTAKEVRFANHVQVSEALRSAAGISRVPPLRVQTLTDEFRQETGRPSTPSRPTFEPFSRFPGQQASPATGSSDHLFSNYLNRTSIGETGFVGSSLQAATFNQDVEMGSDENDAFSLTRDRHRLAYRSVLDHIVPQNDSGGIRPQQNAFGSRRPDTGHGGYTSRTEDDSWLRNTMDFIQALSPEDHPDLRDDLDFIPTPHHPVTPPGFVTAEEIFSDPFMDPSVPPSFFMTDAEIGLRER